MSLDVFFSKLNENLEVAKSSLRMELSKKVNYLVDHLEDYSSVEIRGELENLVDDFISQFTSVYQEFVSYIEDEIPTLPSTPAKPKKKKKAKPKTEAQKKEFVRPTYVHRAFTDEGLRVAKEARPKIMEILNKKIKEDIELIKKQLPTFIKGEKKGEKRRITIKPGDLLEEDIFQRSASLGRELETIPIDLNGKEYKLLILLKTN